MLPGASPGRPAAGTLPAGPWSSQSHSVYVRRRVRVLLGLITAFLAVWAGFATLRSLSMSAMQRWLGDDATMLEAASDECPFATDDHEGPSHHHPEASSSLPQYVAEIVDSRTNTTRYVSAAYQARGVLLLTRFNMRNVAESLLLGERSTNVSTAAAVLRVPRRAVLVLFYYHPGSTLCEEAHRRFVQTAEEMLMLHEQAEEDRAAHQTGGAPRGGSADHIHYRRAAARSQDDTRPRAPTTDADSVQFFFGQLNVEELQPPSSPEERLQEAEELRKTGGPVREWLRSMPADVDVGHLQADVPAVALVIPTDDGGLRLHGFTGRWGISTVVHEAMRMTAPTLGALWPRSAFDSWASVTVGHPDPTDPQFPKGPDSSIARSRSDIVYTQGVLDIAAVE